MRANRNNLASDLSEGFGEGDDTSERAANEGCRATIRARVSISGSI
jgi:hypothetical protein